MTYYPYIINVPGWRFRLEALPDVSTKQGRHSTQHKQPTSLEIALAIRIKDLEIGLRAVLDRVEGNFSSPRLRNLLITDLDADISLLAKAALEAKC